MNKACCNENATGWTILYSLNMTNSSQNCHNGLYSFQQTTVSLQSCRCINTFGLCTTFNVSSQGLSYSKLCGYIKDIRLDHLMRFMVGCLAECIFKLDLSLCGDLSLLSLQNMIIAETTVHVATFAIHRIALKKALFLVM